MEVPMNISTMSLPLHYGKAPHWLLGRMKKLSKIIISLIVEEYGENEFIERISNPIFFQSFSNVLGFDWNSSGTTTVLTGVLKSVLNEGEFGLAIAGGKGKHGLTTPKQLQELGRRIGLGDEEVRILAENSRLAARIDNNALQDGYDLYHHAVVFSENAWTVVQQGMNSGERLARRYHFRPEKMGKVGVEEPHFGIVAERKESEVCNLVSRQSRENRKAILDILRSPVSLKKDLEILSVIQEGQTSIDGRLLSYRVPARLNWEAIERAYELQPENFENVLMMKGMGKNTLRALALVADLVYNAEYDRQDPAKYSFAVGGKDGVPFPVDRRVYDETIDFLENLIEQATLERFEKERIVKRLRFRG